MACLRLQKAAVRGLSPKPHTGLVGGELLGLRLELPRRLATFNDNLRRPAPGRSDVACDI
jgi:hypothetical protein